MGILNRFKSFCVHFPSNSCNRNLQKICQRRKRDKKAVLTKRQPLKEQGGREKTREYEVFEKRNGSGYFEKPIRSWIWEPIVRIMSDTPLLMSDRPVLLKCLSLDSTASRERKKSLWEPKRICIWNRQSDHRSLDWHCEWVDFEGCVDWLRSDIPILSMLLSYDSRIWPHPSAFCLSLSLCWQNWQYIGIECHISYKRVPAHRLTIPWLISYHVFNTALGFWVSGLGFIYIYEWIHIYIYTYKHLHIYIYIYVHIHIFVC